MVRNLFLGLFLSVFLFVAHYFFVRQELATIEEEQILEKAKAVYTERKNAGKDFSSGPCLAEDFYPDWVLDIAHSPREAVDDFPENQCKAFYEGRAHHFVELDPEGNLIRMQ